MEQFENSEDARQKFIEENKISESDWEKAKISWAELLAVANDHASQISSLTVSASMYASLIQGIEGVHSVRWRVKDPQHLIAKIVRKKIEGKEAYAEISIYNYYKIVTDIVGIRALHLFKEDFQAIHEKLNPLLENKENPVVNIRDGDSEIYADLCRGLGLEVKKHAAGYRSIHYVKTVKPMNRDLHIEIQLRTVFEEGWSEVDHRVRYPNFSDNPLVVYASLILNRLSGMADEMSSYARQLGQELATKDEIIEKYQQENNEALRRVDALIVSLEGEKQDGHKKQKSIDELKKEISNLKKSSKRELDSLTSPFGDGANPYAVDRDMAQSLLKRLSLREGSVLGDYRKLK